MKSPNTRYQRTRLCGRSATRTSSIRAGEGHEHAPGIRLHQACKERRRHTHAECDFKSFTNSCAMIFSSPGCSMKEFIERASPCSPEERTMEGFAPRRAAVASCGVNTMWAGSHLMCIWGT